MFELKVFNKMEKTLQTLRSITDFGQHEWIILVIIFFIEIFFMILILLLLKF